MKTVLIRITARNKSAKEFTQLKNSKLNLRNFSNKNGI
jgi:hypothetical protein